MTPHASTSLFYSLTSQWRAAARARELQLEVMPVPCRLRWVFGGDWIVVGRRAISVGGEPSEPRVVKKKKS